MAFVSSILSRRALQAAGPILASRCLTRTVTSQISEVPPNGLVSERPATLVLAEDPGMYKSSWHEPFEKHIPKEYGMQYCNFSMSESCTCFDGALQELKHDLGNFVDAVFIARGPWMSWMAQFYLEDLPFKGLVMVDPMQLDDMNGVNQFQLQYEKLGLKNSQQYKLFQEYGEHWDHWTLKLEPGAVPMMVMYTTDRPAFKRCAENTALRHVNSPDDLGEVVPIHKTIATRPNHAKDAMDTITTWVNERVL